jgi:hypothetical protein
MIPEPTEAAAVSERMLSLASGNRLAVVDGLQDSRGGATEFVAGCHCDLFTDQRRFTREEAIAARPANPKLVS